MEGHPLISDVTVSDAISHSGGAGKRLWGGKAFFQGEKSSKTEEVMVSKFFHEKKISGALDKGG